MAATASSPSPSSRASPPARPAATQAASLEPDSPRPRAGRTAAGRRKVRRSITRAAIDLFLAHGYDTTTVDDIAAAAGVGRRTFFRYFRSKEDSIFPNHDELLADIERTLAESDPAAEAPVDVVCRAVRLVLDSYLADPDVSLKRYRLTRTVTSLRDKEVASVDRYQRVFTRFLRGRLHAAGDPAADMRAPIIGAAVAAAHNHVLRQWLHSDGEVDAHRLADRAFAMVRQANPPYTTGASDTVGPDRQETVSPDRPAEEREHPSQKHPAAQSPSEPAGGETRADAAEPVVAVLHTSVPADELVRRINAALTDAAADTAGTAGTTSAPTDTGTG
ncbi:MULTISPECIES: TetR family transcriptional regulator [Prauserella salsuginis group]|uniref:TetR family transcriptional regulator n=1 Tax=Prauserella salsuginis TaxID=387889 RepID=A0ABW6G1M9_9PSEU|nr:MULTISPECIES: TetR family transcriptional regulator [Prauserella salsuginis group]MCR3722249.1 transcriptional regulator, TetR family [Prauserella flava]MCR3736247.1 transcriptional regulator, TetR family [Prauserella salsuginis]